MDSLSISDLMKAANLTHGGFYGHFPSRADLIVAAVERALDLGEAASVARAPFKPGTAVKAIVNQYLNPGHRDNPGDGCAIGTLSGDVGRAEDDEVRLRMSRQLEASFESMAEAMGGGHEADEAAVMAWCAMVGAINLSRVFRGTGRSDQILKLARQFILDLENNVQQAGSSDLQA